MEMLGLFNFCVFLLASLLSWKVNGAENCTLNLILNDLAGDGWNHNHLTLKSNNQDVTLTDADGAHSLSATLHYGQQTVYTVPVLEGSVVSVKYHAVGKYPTENLWQVQFNQSESPILYQGGGVSADHTGNFTVQCCCTPPQPTGLEITYNQAAPYSATLTWDPVDYAISYVVLRQVNDGDFSPFGDYTETTVSLSLAASTTYRFTVTAVSNFTHGPVSDAVSVSTVAFDFCQINLLQFDNFDDATDRYGAYLSVTVAGGIALYQPFDQKTQTIPLEIPVAAGDVVITSTLVSTRDNGALEFLYELGLTEFYHRGGTFVPANNSFNISCAAVSNTSGHLSAHEEHHLFAQSSLFEADLAMHSPPNSSHREELQAYCQYALVMTDSSGNGWNGMYLSIYLSGTQWASPLYVPSGDSFYTWYFWLNAGTPAQVVYTNNGSPNPLVGAYSVDNWDGTNLGATIVSSGGGGRQMGNTQWTACGAGGTTSAPPVSSPPTTSSRPTTTTPRPTTTTPAPSASCPSAATCASLNRNSCQSSFNPRTCGTCLSGFSAGGATNSNSNSQCSDINECTSGTANCDPNAVCTNTQGSFTCTCNSGFSGNGFTCTQAGCGQRIRREWFSLSAQQQDQYVRAVNTLYSQGTYTQFADYHRQWASFSHGTAAFLPWHRVFLQWFEDTIRGLGGEFTCFTVPYWDWTNSQNTPAMFRNSRTSAGYWTALGVKNGLCFGTGHPFQGFSYQGTCVSRSQYTTPNTLPAPATVASQMQTNFYSTIRPIIESYHNSLHVWVGNTMNQIPQSPADPVFFVHHAFVDQMWATWQTCRGYANIVTQPSNINIVYEPGYSWTSSLPGWSQTPQQVWNLIGTFNVRYARTWFTEAFAGLSSATCPAQNQQFLFAHATEESSSAKHLLSAPVAVSTSTTSSVSLSSKTNTTSHKQRFHKTSNAFRPNRTYLAQQQAIYESAKDTYLETQNITVALDKAFVHACLLGPTLTLATAQLFTPEFIVMMHFQEECDAGLCVNPCWTRLFNSSA